MPEDSEPDLDNIEKVRKGPIETSVDRIISRAEGEGRRNEFALGLVSGLYMAAVQPGRNEPYDPPESYKMSSVSNRAYEPLAESSSGWSDIAYGFSGHVVGQTARFTAAFGIGVTAASGATGFLLGGALAYHAFGGPKAVDYAMRKEHDLLNGDEINLDYEDLRTALEEGVSLDTVFDGSVERHHSLDNVRVNPDCIEEVKVYGSPVEPHEGEDVGEVVDSLLEEDSELFPDGDDELYLDDPPLIFRRTSDEVKYSTLVVPAYLEQNENGEPEVYAKTPAFELYAESSVDEDPFGLGQRQANNEREIAQGSLIEADTV